MGHITKGAFSLWRQKTAKIKLEKAPKGCYLGTRTGARHFTKTLPLKLEHNQPEIEQGVMEVPGRYYTGTMGMAEATVDLD